MTSEKVYEEEEKIRKLVRELSETKRLEFYKQSEKKLKDPDTYATLNYIFIAGLHHFYLGRWIFGLVNITCFWVGAILIFNDYVGIGMIVILGITVLEFYELFRSQVIIQKFNNKVMSKVYSKVVKKTRKNMGTINHEL